MTSAQTAALPMNISRNELASVRAYSSISQCTISAASATKTRAANRHSGKYNEKWRISSVLSMNTRQMPAVRVMAPLKK